MVLRRIILNLESINSIFLLDESLLEPIVSKGTRWVLRRERRSNPPDLSDTSIELMLFTEKLNSKFIIRLTKNAFKKKRRQIKSNDKIIEINLTNSIIKEFDNEEAKEIAKKMGRYKFRIVEITLENGTKEILATNLSPEEFNIEELKELYGQRWSIETGFKKLKSQVMIERFSGHRRIIIEQDFYASIFIYNLATAIQWDGEKQMKVKKRNPDMEFIRKANFASIVGIIYIYMEDILSFDSETVNQVMDFLIHQAKCLYHQKNINTLQMQRMLKIIDDFILQFKWGDEWEDYKPARTAEDSTNDHPGNPKPTH